MLNNLNSERIMEDMTLDQKIENSLEIGAKDQRKQIRLILTYFAKELVSGVDKGESTCNLQNVNARTFEIGEKVQWRGMELIVVEIGVNELLIATDTNPDVENYNDWWVGVEYVR